MKTTLSKIALVIAASLVVDLACAQTSVSQATADCATEPQTNVFKRLDCLKTQKVLLSAELENAQLKKQLDDVRSGKDTSNPAGNATAGRFAPPPTMGMASVPTTLPEPKGATVQLVSTSPKINDGRPTATIQLPSGRIVTAVAGTKLQGVGTVTLVSAQQVMYRATDGHEAGLPFAAEDDVGSR